MRKYSKILLFAMLAVGLMASSVFAGTLNTNSGLLAATPGAPYNIASETLGSARATNIIGLMAANSANVQNVSFGLTLGNALAAGDLLTLTAVGGTFPASTYYVCSQNSASGGVMNNQTGSLVVAAATNSITITVGASAANASNNLAIVNSTCTSAINFPIQVNAGSTGVTVSGVLTASSGAPTKDTFAAINVVNVVAQYAYNNVTAVSNTIDYLASGANGSLFTVGGNIVNATNAINLTVVAPNYTAATAGGLTVSALLNLQDSASWQGVSRVYLAPPATTCTYGSNLIANTTISGTIGLTVPSGTFSSATGAGALQLSLCIETATNAALTPRTITSSQDVVITGTGAVDLAAQSYATLDTWVVNAYQGLAPWLINSSGAPGYCMINNNGTSSATISLNLKSAEAGTLPGTVALGSIAAGKSRTFQFGADSVTEVTTGVTGTAIPITGLTANARYSGLFTVTAAPAAIQITCVQTYTTGSRTLVPVLLNTATGTSGYLTQ